MFWKLNICAENILLLLLSVEENYYLNKIIFFVNLFFSDLQIKFLAYSANNQ